MQTNTCALKVANPHIYARQNSLIHRHTYIHTRVICFEHDQGLQCKLYRENNSGILQTPKCKSGRCNKPNVIQRWNYQINALY